MRPLAALWLLLLAFPFATQAQPADADEPDYAAMAQDFIDSLNFRSGDFHVKEAGATLRVGSGFRYLDAADARRVLEEFWGNPEDDSTLGLIVPDSPGLLADDSWAVVVSYSDDGYVSDEDAAGIDYSALLEEMQEGAREESKYRERAGYPTVELIGWAAPPRYDSATKKLHWAKELAFGDSDEHTLNYDIRVLGRSGYLSLSAISGISGLAQVQEGMQRVLDFTQFDEGYAYADHNPATDKVAAYGIAALIGGAYASKVGLFAKLGALLLAGKKLLIPLIAVVGAVFARLFKRKNDTAV